MLSHRGYETVKSPELKKNLTVRPVENAMGIRPPSFKVYREDGDTLIVPRYYMSQAPAQDTRVAPAHARIGYKGSLREATRQPEAFAAGVKAFETGGGVLSLPCGYGKTIVSLALAGHLGVRTMIIVHKEFLASQWEERINEFCPSSTVGRVQTDRFEIENDFVIAMIQTLCVREHDPRAFESVGLVIVDEAHHIGAPAFSQCMFKIGRAHV